MTCDRMENDEISREDVLNSYGTQNKDDEISREIKSCPKIKYSGTKKFWTNTEQEI